MPSYIEALDLNGVVESLRWGDFLALVNAKKLAMQYVQLADSYEVYALDGPITYVCKLIFSSASAGYPFPYPDGYTAAQNNTDVATFTGTYQSTANTLTNFAYGSIGAAVPLSAMQIGGDDASGNLRAVGTTAASTAATASQLGLVAALSPNSPLPAGTNALGSVSVSSVSGTVAISAASLPLPTGAATQTTLASILANLPAVGQATMANSSPVVIASNQSAIPVTLTSTTITGTVAVTQSTNPWLTQDAADGSVAAGTAGTKSQLGGLVFNTALPTLTTTQQVALQGDSSGRLLVNGSGVTQPVSGTFWQTTQPVSGTFWQTTQPVSGTFWQTTQPVSIASTVAVTQSTSPWIIAGGGTAGTPATGVVSIQGITGGTALSVLSTDTTATGALGALNAVVQIAMAGQSGVGMQLSAGTLIGTLVPEFSFDGGTTWNTTYFSNAGTGILSGSLIFGTANGATAQVFVVPGGVGLVRVRVSAYTSGTANAELRASAASDPLTLYEGASGLPPPPTLVQVGTVVSTASPSYTTGNMNPLSLTLAGALRVDGSAVNQPVVGPAAAGSAVTGNPLLLGGSDGTNVQTLRTNPVANGVQTLLVEEAQDHRPTYSATITNLATATTATDIFTIYGSASKTIRITRMVVSGTQTTAGTVNVLLIKRSAVNTGGTSAASTAVPHDSNNAAATATVLSYTVNPTALGAAVGTPRSRKLYLGAAATASADGTIDFDFGTRNGQPIVLRGVAQGLAVSLNSTTIAGASFDIEVEWTEDSN